MGDARLGNNTHARTLNEHMHSRYSSPVLSRMAMVSDRRRHGPPLSCSHCFRDSVTVARVHATRTAGANQNLHPPPRPTGERVPKEPHTQAKTREAKEMSGVTHIHMRDIHMISLCRCNDNENNNSIIAKTNALATCPLDRCYPYYYQSMHAHTHTHTATSMSFFCCRVAKITAQTSSSHLEEGALLIDWQSVRTRRS